MMKDNIVLLRSFFSEFKNTGTAFKSSKWAAQALTDPLRENRKPKNIIEVGAGTGPVTAAIIREMGPKDFLTIVELNPKFMTVLKKAITQMPEYIMNADRISFFEGPVQDVPEDRKYDVIVSALPFLNFDTQLIEEIFAKYTKLGHDATVMTYYEYIGLRHLGKVVSKNDKERLLEIEKFFRETGHSRLIRRKKVWLNVLPIYIYTLKLPTGTKSKNEKVLAA